MAAGLRAKREQGSKYLHLKLADSRRMRRRRNLSADGRFNPCRL